MDDRRQRFEALVLPHLDAAYRFARWLSRSPGDADDVAQDAILRAFRGFDALRGSDVKPWLLTIVKNCHLTALAAGIVFFFLAPSLTSPIPDDLVSAHVRSLMPDHLIDVVSTDRHTVKPWFAGHADVSPVVADFDGKGYRLIGGRADYFDRQRVAVIVYQHGSHVINVFSWAADQRGLPNNTTRNGYHLAFWKTGNLVYCAVSDTAWDELLGLARLLQDLN